MGIVTSVLLALVGLPFLPSVATPKMPMRSKRLMLYIMMAKQYVTPPGGRKCTRSCAKNTNANSKTVLYSWFCTVRRGQKERRRRQKIRNPKIDIIIISSMRRMGVLADYLWTLSCVVLPGIYLSRWNKSNRNLIYDPIDLLHCSCQLSWFQWTRWYIHTLHYTHVHGGGRNAGDISF